MFGAPSISSTCIMKGWITMFWGTTCSGTSGGRTRTAGGTMPIWPVGGMSSGFTSVWEVGIITGRVIGTWPLEVAKAAVNS